MKNRRLVFFHIPKCAGTSLDAAFKKSFGLYTRIRPGRMFHMTARESEEAAVISSVTTNHLRKLLLAYYLEKKNCVYISGHFPFHKEAVELHRDDCDFVTILRDPVARWLSHYFYNRYKVGERHKICEDLDAFLKTTRARRMGQIYVRLFSGYEFGTNEQIPLEHTQEAVNAATSNLKLLDLIGFAENLNAFATNFRRRFGKSLNIPVKRANPASSEVRRDGVSSSQLREIRLLCEPDIKLYDQVASTR